MKQCVALLLCVWILAMGAFAVSAESTTVGGDVTQTEIITQTTVYYEEVEVEVLEKVKSPYPDGTALVCIVVGVVFIVVAVALVCIYLFAFPRWGLMKPMEAEAETETAIDESAEPQAEDGGETPSAVSLEDLF